jgi:hypothetical protein
MKLSRPVALAALVFVAVAAPVGAFALSGDDGNAGSAHHSAHAAGSDKADKAGHGAAKQDHGPGREHADEASAAGRAHAEAMKTWARCVAAAASGPKTGEHAAPPKDACGDKPMAPGLAKHLAGQTGPFAPGKGAGTQHPRDDEQSHSSH